MRRSFGPMGSGGGGGAMMRTVQRAVRTSYGGRGGSSHDPSSQLTTNYNNNNNNNNNNNSDIISLSSSHHPVNYLNNEYDVPPSRNEVHHALSFLQQVDDPSTSVLQRRDSVRFQRMVSEVASDRSVWDAFINSEAVRELRDSVNEGTYEINNEIGSLECRNDGILLGSANYITSGRDAEPSDSSILLSDILDWIYVNTKAQMMEVLEKTIAMVSNLFRSPRNENNATRVGDEGAANEPRNENNATGGDKYEANEPFENDLRSAFCVSVMVMIIVVLIRASRFRI